MAMLIAAVLSVIFYNLDRSSFALTMILQFFISACVGIIFPLIWSMYADSADYSEYTQGRRATGLVFSASSMSQKLGWTIGGSLTGWLLGYYGFQANMNQTENTLTGIKLMLSIFPSIAALMSVIFIFFYPLNDKKLIEIESELNSRRGKEHPQN